MRIFKLTQNIQEIEDEDFFLNDQETKGTQENTGTKKSFSLAAVGGSTNNINDKSYILILEDYLAKNITNTYDISFNIDYIDLSNNRDFLEENTTYDLVAILNVYNPNQYDTKDYANSNNQFQTSIKHTSQDWNQRLQSTNAQYIFIFGTEWSFSVSSNFIGNINGYQKEVVSPDLLTVYKKV